MHVTLRFLQEWKDDLVSHELCNLECKSASGTDIPLS